MPKTKKQILISIAVVLLIGLGIAAYFYWQKFSGEQVLKKAGETAGKITESAIQGTLPSMDIQSNPMENAPDVNPASQANPFKDIKTNPFK